MNKEWDGKHSHFIWNIVVGNITENTEKQNQFIDLSELWTNARDTRKKNTKTPNQPKHPKQKKARRRDRGTENQNTQELMPFFLKMFNHD